MIQVEDLEDLDQPEQEINKKYREKLLFIIKINNMSFNDTPLKSFPVENPDKIINGMIKNLSAYSIYYRFAPEKNLPGIISLQKIIPGDILYTGLNFSVPGSFLILGPYMEITPDNVKFFSQIAFTKSSDNSNEGKVELFTGVNSTPSDNLDVDVRLLTDDTITIDVNNISKNVVFPSKFNNDAVNSLEVNDIPDDINRGIIKNSTPYTIHLYSSLNPNDPAKLPITLFSGKEIGLSPSFKLGTYIFIGPNKDLTIDNCKYFGKISLTKDNSNGKIQVFSGLNSSDQDKINIEVSVVDINEEKSVNINVVSLGINASYEECPIPDPCPVPEPCPVPDPVVCPVPEKQKTFSLTSVLIISVYTLLIIILCYLLYKKL